MLPTEIRVVVADLADGTVLAVCLEHPVWARAKNMDELGQWFEVVWLSSTGSHRDDPVQGIDVSGEMPVGLHHGPPSAAWPTMFAWGTDLPRPWSFEIHRVRLHADGSVEPITWRWRRARAAA